MGLRAPGRQAIVRWGGMLGLLMLLAGGALAQSPIPGHPDGARDDLATRDWEWDVVRRDGLVVDFIGTSRNESVHPEIAYRVHGDIAAIEGSLLPDASKPAAQPVFNTGVRLFEIVFDPPLALADGGTLERVRPGALDWTGHDLNVHGGQRSLGYKTVVSHPHNATTGTAEGTGTVDVLQLGYTVGFRNMSSDRYPNRVSGEAPFVRSPAMAQFNYHLAVVREALSDEGTRQLNETSARFAFLFDFGGSAKGRTVVTNTTAYWSGSSFGLYLYRGDAAATLTFLDWQDSQPQVEGEALTGGPSPSQEVTNLMAPVALNATLPGARSTTHSADYRLDFDFGYLLDLPGPPPTPAPSDHEEEPAPGATPVILLGVVMILFLLHRRTEAAR